MNNYGSSNGAFQTGETVKVYKEGKRIGKFRLAQSNHKKGKFNSPKFISILFCVLLGGVWSCIIYSLDR